MALFKRTTSDVIQKYRVTERKLNQQREAAKKAAVAELGIIVKNEEANAKAANDVAIAAQVEAEASTQRAATAKANIELLGGA